MTEDQPNAKPNPSLRTMAIGSQGVVVATVLAYGFFEGPVWDLLKYSGALFVVLAFMLLLSAGRRWKEKPSSSNVRTLFVVLLVSLAGAFIYAALGLVMFRLASRAASALWSYPEGRRAALSMVIGAGTLVLGGLFFWFRLRQRYLYGLTEALAGMTVAAHRVAQENVQGIPSDTGFYFAILTAGVYLVVRGFDNMHQALKAGDRFGNGLMRRIRPDPGQPAP